MTFAMTSWRRRDKPISPQLTFVLNIINGAQTAPNDSSTECHR
jgi:hypothetical protein